jgi:Arc/MetJ-type ribon-helix-helix transcriptional regulator
VRAHMILPEELIEEIDELVGPRQRSKFVAEAVREKLQRARLLRLLDKVAGSLANEDISGWETPESAAAWVRASRQSDNYRLRAEDGA